MSIFTLAYWGRNILFVFWENWKNIKVLTKLTDLSQSHNEKLNYGSAWRACVTHNATLRTPALVRKTVWYSVMVRTKLRKWRGKFSTNLGLKIRIWFFSYHTKSLIDSILNLLWHKNQFSCHKTPLEDFFFYIEETIVGHSFWNTIFLKNKIA